MKQVLFAMLFVVAAAMPARADCLCTCVDGAVEPLCTSGFDVPPVCEPRFCPQPPPSLKPATYTEDRPEGAEDCDLKQVMNPHTEKYEWRVLCQ